VYRSTLQLYALRQMTDPFDIVYSNNFRVLFFVVLFLRSVMCVSFVGSSSVVRTSLNDKFFDAVYAKNLIVLVGFFAYWSPTSIGYGITPHSIDTQHFFHPPKSFV
jgi:hypothetical protein